MKLTDDQRAKFRQLVNAHSSAAQTLALALSQGNGSIHVRSRVAHSMIDLNGFIDDAISAAYELGKRDGERGEHETHDG